MLKAFIKDTPFGLSILLLALAVGFIALIAPVGGNKALIVRSGSMQPAIGVGDLITVRPTSNYKVGDIIAFKDAIKPSIIVSHRIVGIETQNGQLAYQTKGDTNEEADFNLVPKENVIGRADYTIRGVGKILAITKTKTGFFAAVAFPALLVILLEIHNIYKEVRKGKKSSTVIPAKAGIQILNQVQDDIRRVQHDMKTDFKKVKSLYHHYGKPMGLPHPSASFRGLYTSVILDLIENLDSRFRGNDKSRFRISARTILPVLAAVLIIGNTFSFFSDTETSTGNVFTAAEVFPPGSGDVVINEIMWKGSSDEWIELRNTTGHTIDISQWTIENAASVSNPIQISPSTTLPAGALYLIAKNKNSSTINVDPDQTTASVSLLDDGEVLTLKTNTSQTIDTAFTGSGWFFSASTPRKSVERKSPPGDGTQAANWQTATTHTNMDGSGPTDEFGTPKAENGT